MSLTQTPQNIKVHIQTVESNLQELEGKNRKSAAPRARKSIQECRKLLTDLRKDIMISVKSLPTTTRVTANNRMKIPDSVFLEPDMITTESTIESSDSSISPEPKPKRKYTKKVKDDTKTQFAFQDSATGEVSMREI